MWEVVPVSIFQKKKFTLNWNIFNSQNIVLDYFSFHCWWIDRGNILNMRIDSRVNFKAVLRKIFQKFYTYWRLILIENCIGVPYLIADYTHEKWDRFQIPVSRLEICYKEREFGVATIYY